MRWLQRLVDRITWSAFMGAGAYRVDGRWRWVGPTLMLALVFVLIATPALAATVCGGGAAYTPVPVIAAQAAPRQATVVSAPAAIVSPPPSITATDSVEATQCLPPDLEQWFLDGCPTP